MRYLWLLTLPLLLSQSGCDTTYPNEEMDVSGSDKTRPFAITFSEPDLAPGEWAVASLRYYEPDPDRHVLSWRIAVDYDLGLYEADEVERDFIEPDFQVPPVWDDQGFCTASISFRIPDDALLRASSQPDVITDEIILAFARPLLEKTADEPVTILEINSFLDTLAATPGWDATWDPDAAEAVRWLSDLFACRIRVRAIIDGTVQVDVVKNLTVRYSHEIDTYNTNENPLMPLPRIVTVPHPDVDYEDFPQYGAEISTYVLAQIGAGGTPVSIPLHHDWSYYLVQDMSLQNYSSPLGTDIQYENYSIRWYHFGLTGAAAHALFVQDDGDEAEMGDLDKEVRLAPPTTAAEHMFRVVTCVRDQRLEWNNYAYAPGARVVMGEFVFTEP